MRLPYLIRFEIDTGVVTVLHGVCFQNQRISALLVDDHPVLGVTEEETSPYDGIVHYSWGDLRWTGKNKIE
jgi:hypothetical protein